MQGRTPPRRICMAVLILAVALSGASSALSGIRTYLSVSRVAPPRMALFDRFRRSKSDCGKTAAKLIAEEVAESKGAATLTDVKREAERLRVESEAADFFRREAVRRWRSSVRARPEGSSSLRNNSGPKRCSGFLCSGFAAADLQRREARRRWRRSVRAQPKGSLSLWYM